MFVPPRQPNLVHAFPSFLPHANPTAGERIYILEVSFHYVNCYLISSDRHLNSLDIDTTFTA